MVIEVLGRVGFLIIVGCYRHTDVVDGGDGVSWVTLVRGPNLQGVVAVSRKGYCWLVGATMHFVTVTP